MTAGSRIGSSSAVSNGIECRALWSETVKIISPVDGSVYAERPIASDAEIDAARQGGAGRAARVAEGSGCRARALHARLPRRAARDERRDCRRACLADGKAGPLWRREGRRRGTHSRHGGAGRGGAQALLPAGQERLPPLHRARAGRRGDGHRAVELSLSHRHQHHRAGPPRRQCHHPQARRANSARR